MIFGWRAKKNIFYILIFLMRMQWTCRFLYKFPQDPSCLMGLSYGCLMGNFQGIGLSYGCLMEISKRGAHFCAGDVQYTLRRERLAICLKWARTGRTGYHDSANTMQIRWLRLGPEIRGVGAHNRGGRGIQPVVVTVAFDGLASQTHVRDAHQEKPTQRHIISMT